jgi:hypothetical protein
MLRGAPRRACRRLGFLRDRIITPQLLERHRCVRSAGKSAISIGGHHVVAESFGGPQARSSPPARKGRSDAEWLDRAEDRRTISRRDGRRLDRSRSSAENNETRKIGKVGGDGAVPTQMEIQCECAFSYKNALFQKNLTDARAINANDVDIASDTGGAFNDGTDGARYCWTRATCIWGVSDPRFSGRRTSAGGWQRGSLTPHMPPSLTLTAAPDAACAANAAGRCDAQSPTGRKTWPNQCVTQPR